MAQPFCDVNLSVINLIPPVGGGDWEFNALTIKWLCKVALILMKGLSPTSLHHVAAPLPLPLGRGIPPACIEALWLWEVPWFHTGPGRPSASPGYPACTSAAPNPHGRLSSLLAEGEESGDWASLSMWLWHNFNKSAISHCYRHRGTCPRHAAPRPRAASWRRHT